MGRQRIMYIENKSGENDLIGDARIGRMTFSKSGKSIHYKGLTFETLSGTGFKANYFDVETGDHYWISGCKKNGSMESDSQSTLTMMLEKSIGLKLEIFLTKNT